MAAGPAGRAGTGRARRSSLIATSTGPATPISSRPRTRTGGWPAPNRGTARTAASPPGQIRVPSSLSLVSHRGEAHSRAAQASQPSPMRKPPMSSSRTTVPACSGLPPLSGVLRRPVYVRPLDAAMRDPRPGVIVETEAVVDRGEVAHVIVPADDVRQGAPSPRPSSTTAGRTRWPATTTRPGARPAAGPGTARTGHRPPGASPRNPTGRTGGTRSGPSRSPAR